MKTLQHPYAANHFREETRKNLVHRFFAWCEKQEKNRLAWLAFIITGHGCLFTPLTILFIILAGNQPVFWPFVIGAMGMALVTNLAALPAKITIPVFFLSILIDLGIIANCIAAGLTIPGTP
jgi:hypothetical protein